MSEIEAKVRYVKLARSLKTYGVSFFLVKVGDGHCSLPSWFAEVSNSACSHVSTLLFLALALREPACPLLPSLLPTLTYPCTQQSLVLACPWTFSFSPPGHRSTCLKPGF